VASAPSEVVCVSFGDLEHKCDLPNTHLYSFLLCVWIFFLGFCLGGL
jgi:hypothetical protein